MDDRDPTIRRDFLIADLEKLATGWTPDDAVLAAAPRIENWYADFIPAAEMSAWSAT